MKRNIVATTIAGLVAAPATVLAQSSATISGFLKGGFENLKLNNFSARRTGAQTNSSQHGVVDDLSRIIFNVREDLGGGLAAIGQLDIRVKLDDVQSGGATLPGSTTGAVGSALAQGNSHVGLQSKAWGRIFIGRQDLHYFNTASDIAVKNSMRADSMALLAFAGAINVKGAAVNGGTAVAGASRTQNVVYYNTPNWGGFTGIIAYSFNPSATEGDEVAGTGTLNTDRKGYAWNLNPGYAAGNWRIGYSYWRSKPDGGLANPLPAPTAWGTANQRGHRMYGDYTFGSGLKVGLAWDNSKLQGNAAANDGITLSRRTVWSIPMQYSFLAKHQITGHYTWARKDTGDVADALDLSGTKASLWAIGYSYDLSKRTSIGITLARINNGANAGYNLYNSTSLGLGVAGVMAGENPRMFGTTIRHAF
jgi:predicted porin